jgi:hypothetical protein
MNKNDLKEFKNLGKTSKQSVGLPVSWIGQGRIVWGEQKLVNIKASYSQACCFCKFEHFANFHKCRSFCWILIPTTSDAKMQVSRTIRWQIGSNARFLNLIMKSSPWDIIEWHFTSENL